MNSAYLLHIAEKHLLGANKMFPDDILYPQVPQLSDKPTCLTDYEPRFSKNLNLLSHILPISLKEGAWKRGVFESLLPGRSNWERDERDKFGHKDKKWSFYGNNMNGPLNIVVNIERLGVTYLCQPPGEWGKLPDGFKTFWSENTEIYLTNVDGYSIYNSIFNFDKSQSTLITYTNRKPTDTQTICVDFDKQIDIGTYVMSIVPTTDKIILIGLVILP
jgi:hypothetical protein